MKKLATCVVVCCLLCSMCFPSFAGGVKTGWTAQLQNKSYHTISNVTMSSDYSTRIEKVDNTEQKVWDFANLLSDDQEASLQQIAQNYLDKFQLDMVIVTIDDANGLSAMEYADDFYDYNGYGVSRTIEGYTYEASGILLLLDMDNRMIYLSTTGYAINLYPDTDVNKIVDAAWNYLPNGEYYNALEAGAKEATSLAAKKMSAVGKMQGASFWQGDYVTVNLGFLSGVTNLTSVIVVFVIALALSACILAGILHNHRKTLPKVTDANRYLKREDIIYGQSSDIFVNTYTTVTRIVNNSSSGGGSGGGSSTHTSSSGGSHGGGGRSF